MSQQSSEQLAAWLAKNQPEIFDLILREAATQSAKLNGISDFISNIGSSLTTAVKSVGNYLSSENGINTLSQLGVAYYGYKTQNNVLQTQVKLAQAGQSPAPVVNTLGSNGQVVPVYTPTNQVATDQLLYQLQPSFLQQYKMPLLIGGGVLLAVVLGRSILR